MEDNHILFTKLEDLRSRLALSELLSKRRTRNNGLEALLINKGKLIFRMDASLNHQRPHFHVQYEREFHALSICINTSEVLIGDIPSKYLRTVQDWTKENKEVLLKIWKALRESKNIEPFLIELK